MPRAHTDRPRYRRISTRLHGDDRFRQLSAPKPNGRYLWLYLLTGPHTGPVPGLFSVGEHGLAENLEWSIAGFRRVWRELEALQMVKTDWVSRLIWLPAAIKHNAPENPNVISSWKSALSDLPECPLKAEAVATIGRHLAARGESFSQKWAEICAAAGEGLPLMVPPNPSGNHGANPSGNQDQEQETGTGTGLRACEPVPLLLQRFDRFWSRYPLQQGKEPAWKAWLDISPTEAHTAEILAGVEHYRTTKSVVEALASGETQYVMRPKNWLRESRWEDARGVNTAKAAPLVCRHRHTPPCDDDPACVDRYLRELESPPFATEAEPDQAVSA